MKPETLFKILGINDALDLPDAVWKVLDSPLEERNAKYDTFWNYFVVFGVLCPYINFIVFIFKIWSKANGFKRNINDSKEQLKKKCQEAKKDEDDLLATVRIEAKLKTD